MVTAAAILLGLAALAYGLVVELRTRRQQRRH